MAEEFDSYCTEIVQNFFPDCVELRTLCLRKGYLPNREHSEIIEGESKPSDIANLFCKRTNRHVTSGVIDILSVLLTSSSPMPMPKASACLYTFCNRHLPLYLLDANKTKCEKLVSDKLSTLIRVLVLYHFPLLAIHLDCIAPDWAQLFGGSIAEATGRNLIPNMWIGGLFAGSVLQYPDNTLKLWDWCVCWGECYAGVYLVVSLLGLNEKALRHVATLQELQEWLCRICRGGMPAFQSCTRFRGHILSVVTCDESESEETDNNDDDGGFDLSTPLESAPPMKEESDSEVPSHSGRREEVAGRDVVEKEEDDEEYGDEEDEDEDEDDDFPLETNNLTQMNEIHTHTCTWRPSLSVDERDSTAGGDGDTTGQSFTTAWGDDDAEQQDEEKEKEMEKIEQTEEEKEGEKKKEEGLLSLCSQTDDDRTDQPLEEEEEEEEEGGSKTKKRDTAKVTAEQLELMFLTGWLHATVHVIRATPQTYRHTLSSIFQDMEQLLADKKAAGKSRSRSHSWSVSGSQDEENPYDDGGGGELDLTSHGFEEEEQRRRSGSRERGDMSLPSGKRSSSFDHNQNDNNIGDGDGDGDDYDDNEGREEYNYREEYGSDYSNSAPPSPLTPFSSTPSTGRPGAAGGEHVTSLSTYGLNMLNKGLSMITHKESDPSAVYGRHSLLSTVPKQWLWSGHRHTPCVGTSAEEVLPCICSNRRYASSSSSSSSSDGDTTAVISQVFCDGALASSSGSSGSGANGLMGGFPPPSAIEDQREGEEKPFYFAIDCWPEVSVQEEAEGVLSSDRLCKIPKALQMSNSDVMNENFIDNIISILQPLAGLVHVVLIGKGNDLIRCNHSGDPAVTPQSVQISIHEQSAQLGALALTLAKHGIPRVSILDGGYGSVLRCFWNSEHADEEEENEQDGGGTGGKNLMLSFDLLFDVDHDAIQTLFLGNVNGDANGDGDNGTKLTSDDGHVGAFSSKKKASITESSSLLGAGRSTSGGGGGGTKKGNAKRQEDYNNHDDDDDDEECEEDDEDDDDYTAGGKSRGVGGVGVAASVAPTAAYISGMFTSSGSSVASGMAGLFSSKNKMFSYGSS